MHKEESFLKLINVTTNTIPISKLLRLKISWFGHKKCDIWTMSKNVCWKNIKGWKIWTQWYLYQRAKKKIDLLYKINIIEIINQLLINIIYKSLFIIQLFIIIQILKLFINYL